MSSTGGTDSIFLSCRKGNLTRIKYLVEVKEIDLNVRDCWDSTPLYYACHCGHVEVVEYLLANGARCEENTFDGERCIYGALTNEIKTLLLRSKVADMGTQKLDDFDDFCKRLLTAEEFADFTIRLRDGKAYKLHRCVLAARSSGLNSLLAGKWSNVTEVTNTIIDPPVFDAFVKYLYTGKLKCSRDDYDEMKKLASRCELEYIIPLLEQSMQQSRSFERSKKNIKVTTLVLDTPQTREILEEEFCTIIDGEMDDVFAREPFHRLNYSIADDDIVEQERKPYHDICFQVDGALFFCNKVFICTRSEYFVALLQDHFNEYREYCNGIPKIVLRDISPSVFACILYYIYSNRPHNLNEEIVYDVMEASDMYFLPGLTKICGSFLSKTITTENAVDLCRLARMRDLGKLESCCIEFMAENLRWFYTDGKFRALVIQDAKEVACRQETDSIPVIDDIRYYITISKNRYPWYADDESSLNLELINDLLDELDLDA